MACIFQKMKQNKVSVLAVLLVAAMLVGILPFGMTVHAEEINLGNVADAIGTVEGTTLRIFGDEETGIDKLYTYKSGAWTPDDGKNYIAKVDDITALQGKTLQAVSPAGASATEFTIPTDQSTAEKLLSADWCVSNQVDISETMSFELSHLLSKVTVIVDGVGEGYTMPTFDGTTNKVRFSSYTNVTYVDGTRGTSDTSKKELIPYQHTTADDKTAFTAMVYPIEQNKQLLLMFLGYATDNSNLLVVNSNVDMESGKHYTFKLTIKTNAIELTLDSVNPFDGGWNNEVNLDGTTETIGKVDEGKTGWVDGDEVTLSVTGGGIAGQTGTITYTNGVWSEPSKTFRYLTDNDVTVSAVYSEGDAGLSENLQVDAEVTGGKVTINFPEKRPYSRLRIAGEADKTYSVTFTNFTPAGGGTAPADGYTLTVDVKGNKFLYGTWEEGSKITVTSEGTTIAEHTLTASENGKSYVLRCLPPTDLSLFDNGTRRETANCYIVTGTGYYTYPATHKGNADITGATHKLEDVQYAKVLWESFGTDVTPNVGDLVSNVTYGSDGFISFTATEKKGNAVIAAYNSNDEIVWSWHIWLTDQPEEHTLTDGTVMLDRNLGATSATASDGVLTHGLMYQWGRKDPFLGSSSETTATVAASTATWPAAVASVEGGETGSYAYGIQNPMIFLTKGSPFGGENIWNKSNWGSTKTIYDPSPAGYRVPETSVWTDNGFANSYTLSATGATFTIDGNDIWYPLAGYRPYDSGDLGMAGGYYTSTVTDSNANIVSFYIMFFNNNNRFGTHTAVPLGNAANIRCVKIQDTE